MADSASLPTAWYCGRRSRHVERRQGTMQRVTAVLVVVVAVLLLVALLALARWRESGDELPLFVTDGRCPVCGHAIREHDAKGRLSGVFQGCEIAGCECATPITRIPTLRR